MNAHEGCQAMRRMAGGQTVYSARRSGSTTRPASRHALLAQTMREDPTTLQCVDFKNCNDEHPGTHREFHEHKRKRPTKNVQALLDHIETGGDPIFWG